ncbi:helix-turn-helix transcriptional regulator [Effusibacillus dendaii]|uniref:helix-turn-helix transcriptional regulator n=1 Tax=Effusibacillus dendaii TaxID=2743772 RepID=UPI001CF7A3A8|nr:helix-turn-helix transcriptional regulator [Effusibacillus dendaii]
MGELENRLKAVLDGRTIKWLSDKTGINRNTITSYINGTVPPLDKAYAIARVLGVSVYDIWPQE